MLPCSYSQELLWPKKRKSKSTAPRSSMEIQQGTAEVGIQRYREFKDLKHRCKTSKLWLRCYIKQLRLVPILSRGHTDMRKTGYTKCVLVLLGSCSRTICFSLLRYITVKYSIVLFAPRMSLSFLSHPSDDHT